MRRRFRILYCVLCVLVCLLALSSCSQRLRTGEVVTLPSDGWLLMVNQEGPYWLGSDWWAAIGVDSSTLSYGNVELQKDGESVPYLWIENEGEKGLLFYGEVTASRLGSWGGYALQIGQPGLEMEKLDQPLPSNQVCQQTSIEHEMYELNTSYRSTAPIDSPWLWAVLHPPSSITLTVPLTHSITGPISVTTWMWGQSQMPQNPDHHIRLMWDENQMEDHFWDGNKLEKWDSVFRVDANASANLVIASPGETDAPVEATWLDKVEITWRKSLIWSGTGWERWFPGEEPGVCWKNRPENNLIVLLLSSEGIVYQANSSGSSIPQGDAVVGWIGNPPQAPAPTFTRPRELLNQDELSSIEYVAVAPQPFHTALLPLVERQLNEGLSVLLVSPEQVYDTYGQGIPDGTAIKTMVTTLVRNGNLRYLLVVGDTTTSINITPEEMLLQVPTGWVNTSIVGETPSDFALVSDEDGMPVAAVGRFPASNEAEVTSMVKKTLGWTSNKRLLFVGDDNVEFDRFIDQIAEVSPSDSRLRAGDLDSRKTLLSWLREDSGIMIYSGHGSLPMLGDEKLLTQEDAGIWNKPTVVIAWSCLCASFTHPFYQGLGESWLKSSRGTVAFIGPTGETTSAQQSIMAVAVQKSLVAGDRIGDALLFGWQDAQSYDAKVSFLLLGDPALRPFPVESE